MTHSERRQLDRQFATAFGYTADGRARYRWMQASELFVKLHSNRSPEGVWYSRSQCEQTSLREIYGDVWICAVFRDESPSTDPNPILAHIRRPSDYGRYTPIDGSQLQRGMEPDADVTAAAIYFIRKHIEKSYRDHLEEANAAAGQAQAETKKEFGDKIDDAWPAFGNAPGMKAHVSFPPIPAKGQNAQSNDCIDLPA
jgi:hypothetical protein